MSTGPVPELTSLNRIYWEGTAKHELRFQRCNVCSAGFRFVRSICPQCWSDDIAWDVSSGEGTIIAKTVVHIAPYESVQARVPYVLALIELAEQVSMMANIIACEPEAVQVGMRVAVTFEQRSEFAIPQFRLQQGQSARAPEVNHG